MKSSRQRGFFVVAVVSVITGTFSSCAVGPDYRAQPPPLPPVWSADSATGALMPQQTWWIAFADPMLNQLVEQSRQRNHDLRLAQSRLREALALRGVELGALGPQIDAVGGVDRTRSARSDLPQSGTTRTTWRAGFDASWELDLFGVTRRAIEVAGAEVDQAQYQIADALVSVTAEVVTAYLELRANDERLAAIQQAQSALERLRDRAAQRLGNGLADDAELAQTEADLGTARVRVPQFAVARAQALHRLAVLAGELPNALTSAVVHLLSTPDLRLARAFPDPVASLASGLPSELLQRRPDLRQAERAVAAATARIGVAKGDYYPRFSLTGTFGWSADDADGLFSADHRVWSIGPSIRWPLFSGGRIASQVKAADARLEQAGLRYEQAVLRAAAEVEDALVRTARSRERVAAAHDALSARQRAADLITRRFDGGLVDISFTLEQERLLADARIQLVDARSEQGLALTALAKALGGGWDQAK